MASVFRYRVFDIMNDAYAIPQRHATVAFIAMARGEIIEGTGREVDDRLLTDNGQVIQEFDGHEAELLKELNERGTAQVSGNKDHKTFDRMVISGLMNRRSLSVDCVEYEITDLGRKAVEQLL